MIRRLLIQFRNMVVMDTFDPKVIKFLWKECHIPISWNLKDGYGTFRFNTYSKKSIGIYMGYFNGNKLEKLTTLLHEVGHYKDFEENKKLFIDRHLKGEDKLLEKIAWKHAMRFSEQYNIPMSYSGAKKSLKTYDAEYACLNNKVKYENYLRKV